MKKTLSVLVTAAVLSLGLTACNGGSNDCEGAGASDVVTMSLVDGKSGGSSGGRSSRSGGGKSSSGKSGSKSGSSKSKKHKSHDFDDDCDD